METRKVQKTGKSTLMVSLPKRWANINAISDGSLLFFSQNQNGDLLLSNDISEKDSVVKLDITGKCGEPLIREIIACYIAGYKTIEVSSNQMTAGQKRDLHSIVNKLIGPEILEETISKVIIHDLLSSEDLQADRALKRIKNLTRSMIQDSLSALIKMNKELARDVIQRDNDVDRLNLLITRQFIDIFRSGSLKPEARSPICAYNYMLVAQNLERIADHASKIAKTAAENDHELPAVMSGVISELTSVFVALIDESIPLLFKPNTEKANQLIDRAIEIKKRSKVMENALYEQDEKEIRIRMMVMDSIERILDLVININELAINMHSAVLDK